jgi:quinol monooxygenase YgiN
MAKNTITPMILIDATYRMDIDDVEAFKAVASRMAAAAAKRDGCAFMKVAQGVDDPTTFHLFEGWRDRDSFDAHLASEGFQQDLADAGKLKIADRVVDTYTVSGSTPLVMPS